MPDTGYSIKDRASYFIKTRAWNLIKEYGINHPPILAAELATKLGIRVSETHLKDISGLLAPTEKGLQIKLNTEDVEVRKNFSCAHELMHTYFLDGKGRFFIETVMKNKGFNAARNLEERLCDIGAIELIAPYPMFKPEAERMGFSIKSLEILSKLFFLSIPSTAIRLTRIFKSYSAICWKMPENSVINPDGIRISYATAIRFRTTNNTSSSTFFKPLLTASKFIKLAYTSKDVVCSHENLPVGKLLIPCHIESKGFLKPPFRYVISLAIPKDRF